MSETLSTSRSSRRHGRARARALGAQRTWRLLALALVALGVLAGERVGPAPLTAAGRAGAARQDGGRAADLARPPARPSAVARLWRALAIALIALGALALLDAGVTLVWQEPFTALYAKLRQDHLSGALRTLERAQPTPLERAQPTPLELRTLASLPNERRRIAFLARELERRTAEGGPVGRIIIPHIGANFVVVKGTGTEDLKSGPGVYPQTPFPGAGSTTAIAGHRTTYLAPFRHIDSLRPGDRILLFMPYGRFTYTVIGQRVVAPTDVGAAVAARGYHRLVLSACTPLFSAAKRLLVFASLKRILPVGAARVVPGGGRAIPIETPRAPRSRRDSPAVFEPLEHNLLSTGVQ